MKEINWKYKIGQTIIDDKRNLTIIDRKIITRKNDKNLTMNEKWYKYKCHKCGFMCGEHWSLRSKEYKDELWVIEYSLSNKIGCSCCGGNQIVVKGKNDIYTTNPMLVRYFVNIEDGYTHKYSSKDKVLMKCPHCGHIKEHLISINTLYTNNGFKCVMCKDGLSYPNKFMYYLLKQLKVKFKTEYSPQWVGLKRYDFYIPSMNLIIEMDGGLGHGNQVHGKSEKTLEETISSDFYKDLKAMEHNIKVIRINCYYKNVDERHDFIKNNIVDKLNDVIDLNNVNWVSIEKQCEKALVKEICIYWKMHNNINDENLTTTDLGIIFNRSRHTISSYLKKGNKLGWCNYDADEEIKKSYVNMQKTTSRKIMCLNDNKIFNSISDASKYYNIDNSSISKVCYKKRKSAKNKQFIFYNEQQYEYKL